MSLLIIEQLETPNQEILLYNWGYWKTKWCCDGDCGRKENGWRFSDVIDCSKFGSLEKLIYRYGY